MSRIAFNGQSYYYNYDLNGNMTYEPDFTNPGSIQSRTIYYNADNMPSQINHSSGGITNYLYDGMGNRVRKSVGSTYTYYIGDHFEVKGGVETKYIFAGNLRIAQYKNGELNFFHKDHLGSSTVMTYGSGAELESTEYMPFGSQRNHSGTYTSGYRFTDQELDAENGLYNYNARLYDPVIGRFISPDTIVQAPYNPQTLNRYSYCLNNPLIYVDPSGHYFWPGQQNSVLEPFGGWDSIFDTGSSFWDPYQNYPNQLSEVKVAFILIGKITDDNGNIVEVKGKKIKVGKGEGLDENSTAEDICWQAKREGLDQETGGGIIHYNGKFYPCVWIDREGIAGDIYYDAVMKHEIRHLKEGDVILNGYTGFQRAKPVYEGKANYRLEAIRHQQTIDDLDVMRSRCAEPNSYTGKPRIYSVERCNQAIDKIINDIRKEYNLKP